VSAFESASPGPTLEGQAAIPLTTRAGWNIASGLVLGNGPQGEVRAAFFIHLWLVPMIAAAMLAVAWYAAQRRMSVRLAAGCVLALSVLEMLVVVGYAVQVASLAQAISISLGVAWGAWLAMVESLALCVIATNLLRPAVPRRHADVA
jgi:hypothetical protein